MTAHDPAASVPIGSVAFRQRTQVTGTVRSMRVRPWADVSTLEIVLADDTGGLTVAFLGRRRLGGIHPGARLTVDGMIGVHGNKLVLLNPAYTLLGDAA